MIEALTKDEKEKLDEIYINLYANGLMYMSHKSFVRWASDEKQRNHAEKHIERFGATVTIHD